MNRIVRLQAGNLTLTRWGNEYAVLEDLYGILQLNILIILTNSKIHILSMWLKQFNSSLQQWEELHSKQWMRKNLNHVHVVQVKFCKFIYIILSKINSVYTNSMERHIKRNGTLWFSGCHCIILTKYNSWNMSICKVMSLQGALLYCASSLAYRKLK
jgi:hypothetical protein